MAPTDRDPAPLLEYVAGNGAPNRGGWVDRNGERLDTIEKLAAHLAAAEAAAVANGH